ncbi:MAG TPA: ABC transporter permease subunit [Bacillota bacterium]|nr:ABC transporter permease subunit [Bacillota bacterium]
MARGTSDQSKHKSVSYRRFGYIFILPFFLVYIIFSLYPLITTFAYSATNMGKMTAEFYGFSNREYFYDRYLDMVDIYGDDLETYTGVDKATYIKMKSYFELQNSIETYDPLNADGMNFIIALGESQLSAATISAVQSALDNHDPSALDGDPAAELQAYSAGFVDLGRAVQNKLGSYNTVINGILNPETESEEEVDTATLETEIKEAIPAYVETIVALKDDPEANRGQLLLIDYYATMLNDGETPEDSVQYMADYFTAFADGTKSITDTGLYGVLRAFNSPSAKYNTVDEEGNAKEATIPSITCDFILNYETYLKNAVWVEYLNGLSTVSSFSAYSTNEIDLHHNEEQVFSDIESLISSGIIGSEYTLGEEDGKLVIVSSGVLDTYREFIDTNYQSDAAKLKAVAHIDKIIAYVNNARRYPLLADANVLAIGGIDKALNFSGDRTFDADKYATYKEALGLADKLSLENYERFDQERKDKKVAEAKAIIAENEPLIPAAEQALKDAEATGDKKLIQTAMNDLSKINNNIKKANTTIDTPKGILQSVSTVDQYVFVGLDNYVSIFTNPARFSIIAGAFYSTAFIWVMNFIPQILLALLLASWMTDNRIKLKGMNAMKALIYLPNIITAVTIAVLFRKSFAYSTGGSRSVVQQLLVMCGDENGFNFFQSATATRIIVAFINFWMWYGNTMIALIAGISSVSVSLYESAEIDGASQGQTFRKITLPLIRPIMLYILVTSLIGGLQMYDVPQNLNAGHPDYMFLGNLIPCTRTVLMYIQQQAFGLRAQNQVGLASAVSVVLFVITTILSILVFYIMRDKDAARAKKLAKKGGTGK